MGRLFSLLLAFFLCVLSFGNGSALEQLQEKGAVRPRATSIYEIYSKMLKNMGLSNQAGHTMAAAVLTRCLKNRDIKDHLIDFGDILKAMTLSEVPVIARGANEQAPQITYAAASLTCRKNDRSAGEMVTLLEVIYGALLEDRLIDWLPNVVAASELVN